jgi:hypothetical protein
VGSGNAKGYPGQRAREKTPESHPQGGTLIEAE